MKELVRLWLDDLRDPETNAPFYEGKTVWVKSVPQFSAWINENGLPDFISFDYHLGKDLDFFEDGIGALKSVIRYCIAKAPQLNQPDGKLPFPKFAVHSTFEKAYILNEYIIRNIRMYGLGEIRQEGTIHKKPIVTEKIGFNKRLF